MWSQKYDNTTVIKLDFHTESNLVFLSVCLFFFFYLFEPDLPHGHPLAPLSVNDLDWLYLKVMLG